LKKVIWDSVTNTGDRILDFIPDSLVDSKNSQEMKIRFKNGSLLQIVGSDNYDSLMGTNPQGVVFSEYALQDPRAYQYIRPILAANLGWALFISTPRGKNHLYELYQIALHSENWFAMKLTLDDTQHISLAEIERERAEGVMSEDLIQQEYYTSFDMGVEGAYYAKYMDKMRLDGRIGDVPYEPGFKVNTAWDLGVRDSTTIIFFQTVGTTIRIVDCYENSKEGLDHYAKVLAAKPYLYGKHIAPHDIAVRELGSGMTRIEKAKQLGIKFTIADNISIVDGIEAVRSTLNKVWIDQKCVPLIKALENYRQEYDVKNRVYKTQPLHNFASHFCFTADTLVLTRTGMRQIVNIQDNEEVLTLSGWKKCLGAKSMRKNVSVVRVTFADGVTVNCTPDHLFLTESGWISAENLSKGSMIQSSLTTEFKNIMAVDTIAVKQNTICGLMVKDSIRKFGSMLLEKYRPAATFITKTMTPLITNFRTWCAYLLQNISRCLNLITKDSAKKPELALAYGMQATQEESGIAHMLRELRAGKNRLESKETVCFAEENRCYCKGKIIPKSSATQTAKPLMVEKVEKIEGLHDVWCINVPEAGHFSLSNGAIVSNSDAMRYLCVSLPKTRDGLSSEELDRRYQEAVMGSNAGLPSVFRDDLGRY
jgi:phage terminase large subunit